jgi:biotin carboxyl carrier protein
LRPHSAELFAKQRRDRAKRLFELKAGSRQDLESAEADPRNAEAAIQKARSELEKEQAHLEIFQIPFDDPAPGNANSEADDIPVAAPASGAVLDRKVSVGSVVNAGDEMFAITDTSHLWTIAGNEADLSMLREGQQSQIEARAYPGRIFPGSILGLGEQLDPETRTLQVRILVPNPRGLLKPPQNKEGILSALFFMLRRDCLLDHEIRMCNQRDCGKFFKVERGGQRFCSDECSRLERQRDYWQRKGKAVRARRVASTRSGGSGRKRGAVQVPR